MAITVSALGDLDFDRWPFEWLDGQRPLAERRDPLSYANRQPEANAVQSRREGRVVDGGKRDRRQHEGQKADAVPVKIARRGVPLKPQATERIFSIFPRTVACGNRSVTPKMVRVVKSQSIDAAAEGDAPEKPERNRQA